MSLFLGPTYHRCYRSVETTWRRRRVILKALEARFGGQDLVDTDGHSELETFALAEPGCLLGQMASRQIRSWLLTKGRQVERSEAALLATCVERFGGEVLIVAGKAAYDFGRSCGQEAREELREDDPYGAIALRRAYGELFLDYFLDVLPGAPPTRVEESPGLLVSRHGSCPHLGCWQVPLPLQQAMCRIIRRWMDGFFEGLDCGMVHLGGKSILEGDSCCEDFFEQGVDRKGAGGG